MLDPFVQVCLNIIIVLGALNMILLLFLILICIIAAIKIGSLVSDVSKQYKMIKSFVSSPITFILEMIGRR